MSNSTLSERYVAAAMRTIPENQRTDLADELRGLIADQIDARAAESAESAEDAEKAVLKSLGDPDILAAGYTDRPLQLIGPRYFLTWWRLLKLLLWIVIPTVAGALVLAGLIEGKPLDAIIGLSVGTSLMVGVHLCFWVTLVFAIIDRAEAGSRKGPAVPWTLDNLPLSRETGAGKSDVISALVLALIAFGVLLWDRFVGFIPSFPVPLLNPELWPAWMVGLFVLMGLGLLVSFAVYRVGRWTPLWATLNMLINIAVTVPMLLLLSRGELYNPVAIARAQQEGLDDNAVVVLGALTAVIIIGSALADTITTWVRTWRARKQPLQA